MVYSNGFSISRNDIEVIMQFQQLSPDPSGQMPTNEVVSKIVMNPQVAETFAHQILQLLGKEPGPEIEK